jgi:putative flavoprotein involved in K+ transport
MDDQIETIIIGAGQAGLSLSYFLTQANHEHVVFEKSSQVANAWHNERWDSFTLVTPNWSIQLPGDGYHDSAPDGFMPRLELVARFEQYAVRNRLPMMFDTRVQAVDSNELGYTVKTQAKDWHARNVVVATGFFQKNKIPPCARLLPAEVRQIESSRYRSPEQLPPGAVLVVGSGQSGSQIAEELYQDGRKVFLSVSPAARAPRRYRGHDIVWWLKQSGFFSRPVDKLPDPRARLRTNPLLTGKNGGYSLNLHKFAREGVTLLGHLEDIYEGKAFFKDDLYDSLAKSDRGESEIVKQVDQFIAAQGLDLPGETLPEVRDGYLTPIITRLDLQEEKISVVVWAGGFSADYSLVHFPVVDEMGFPITRRGVTHFPGLYFLGMPWIHTQESGLLMGVATDAAYLAEQITGQPII